MQDEARQLAEFALGTKAVASERVRQIVLTPAGYDLEVLGKPRRPGRRGRDDLFYAEVAELYVKALDRGSRRPALTSRSI